MATRETIREDGLVALHTRDQLLHLIPKLAALPRETEWVELKQNNIAPEIIGKTVSALSNSARLAGESYGYMIWGVRDEDHAIVGTAVDPENSKVKGQEILHWLSQMLDPDVYFEFTTVILGSRRVVLLTVEAASFQPVQFQSVAYVRLGSYTKPLSKHADLARRLWRSFEREPFEAASALEGLTEDDVLRLLDYPAYFELLGRPLPDNRSGIFEGLIADELVGRLPGLGWRITNLGGLLLAKSLNEFPSLSRKALRVIQYNGRNKVETFKERVGQRGYASGFQGLIAYINGVLPVNEAMGQALRTSTPMYPELAVRELVANALIHQDFSVGGSGPMIEIFEDRLEISNPGSLLVEKERLIDAPPRSRNEKLAALMRRMGICEEQGSGWDKVAFQIELHQLPAPAVETTGDGTRIVVLSPRPLSKMSPDDKLRAVYLHACLRQISREHTNNSSIRERFGIPEKNKAAASRLLGDAVKAGLIVPYDAAAGVRSMRYVPFWAAPSGNQTEFVDA